MNTMQAFYERLSTSDSKPNTYQHHLALLTRVKRIQLLHLRSDLQWAIWN